jgi:SAM-dependent methyltransferase
VTPVFGDAYARVYPSLYAEKDYDAECDVVERVLAQHARGRIETILDLGCGTGGHAIPLASRGFAVTGVDVAPAMLERARSRAAAHGAAVDFHEADLRTLDLDRRADAVLMLFAVLGYQTTNDDLLAALRTARRHVADDGLLLFDVWFGPAVLMERPETRTKEVPVDGGGTVIRTASSSLEPLRDVCTVAFRVTRVENGQTVEEFEEAHAMRYFFAPELELVLGLAGFELVHLSAFPDIDRPADESTWNVLVGARPA